MFDAGNHSKTGMPAAASLKFVNGKPLRSIAVPQKAAALLHPSKWQPRANADSSRPIAWR